MLAVRGLRRGGTGCSTKGDQAQPGWEPGLALEDTNKGLNTSENTPRCMDWM